MPDLEHYCEKWGLSDPSPLTQTPRANLHSAKRGDQDVVLKIFTAEGAGDEARGSVFLKLCKGHSAVNVLEHDDGAVLMDYIDGPCVEELSLDGRDEEATEIIGHVLGQIHSVPIPNEHNFFTLERYFKELFEQAEIQSDPLFKRAAQLARTYLNDDYKMGLLHGDMHHGNVMHDSQLGWLAIDPKGVIGDPAYDTANVFHNPHAFRSTLDGDQEILLKRADILAHVLNLEASRIIGYSFIHGCLSASWSLSSDDENGHIDFRLSMASVAEKILEEY